MRPLETTRQKIQKDMLNQRKSLVNIRSFSSVFIFLCEEKSERNFSLNFLFKNKEIEEVSQIVSQKRVDNISKY